VPRSIEAELRGDLVDACCAGDCVTLLGLVRVINTEAEAGARGAVLWLSCLRPQADLFMHKLCWGASGKTLQESHGHLVVAVQ
jgi:hypothetical protein